MNNRGRNPDPHEREASAEHLRDCPECAEELKGIVAQRATIHGVFCSAALPVLPESLIVRCVRTMARAAREDENRGLSAG